MDNKNLFIITNDNVVANKLLDAGYVLIKNSIEGTFTFLNECRQVSFNEKEKTKIKYSNILCM